MSDCSEFYLQSDDGHSIFIRHFSVPDRRKKCLIVAPGFASHGGLQDMREVCELLTTRIDLVCLDFRGNGKSSGRYTFGKDEYRDLIAAIGWCEKRYEEIFLLGFSLGAYTTLRAVTFQKMSPAIRHIFLVSCPTYVQDVIWRGGVFRQAIDQVIIRRNFKKDRSLFFRWGNPFSKKPSSTQFAPLLDLPVSFMVAKKDLLVPKEMTRAVFDQITHSRKSWLEMPHALHADEIFRAEPEICVDWIFSKIP